MERTIDAEFENVDREWEALVREQREEWERLRREIENEWLLATSGALSILLGIGVLVLIALNIETTIIAAGYLIGGYALCAAIVLGALGFRLREYQRSRDQTDKDEPSGDSNVASPA